MRSLTFRARVALWSVAVVFLALTLFGAGAAWNLRRGLVENVDQEITDRADAFAAELDEQELSEGGRPQSEVFSAEDMPRFPYVEVRNGQRLLYRSPALANKEVFPSEPGTRPNEFKLQGHTVRFRVFRHRGITFALGKDLQPVEEALSGLLHAYFVTLPLVVLAVGAGGWFIADRAVAPIRLITGQAEKISASELDQRLPPASAQDEIGHLTKVLNQMFERLQRSFEQVNRFTSDAAHELKTPLALMQAEAETALQSPQVASQQRAPLVEMSEQCSRLSQIVDGLLLLSRADDRRLALEQEPIDLVRLVRELLEDAEILAEPAGLKLECKLPEEVTACGDRRLLARAVMNLIANAIKYNQDGGRVNIAAAKENGQAVLKIGNTGPGLPSNAVEQIFERFYRGDPSHSSEMPGHGLGLSIAREITRVHGGDVLLVHSSPEWTEFHLQLPLANGRDPATERVENQSTDPVDLEFK